jgi:glutaredoxin-like protein
MIDRIPATVVQGEIDYGIRIYGIPAGHELATLLDVIRIISTENSQLSDEIKEKLESITNPVHIQVFVTLNCPYCPPAAILGHRLAFESDHIRTDMINAQEFPKLAQKYNVFAVPKIVINETIQFEGALREDQFIQKVMDSVK